MSVSWSLLLVGLLVSACAPSGGGGDTSVEAGPILVADAQGQRDGGAADSLPPAPSDAAPPDPPPSDAAPPDACAPQCAGRMCGRDGCGGACGGCPNTQFCKRGMCTDLPAQSALCEPCLTAESCADADALCVGEHPDKICTRACICPGGGAGCASDACPEGMTCAEYTSGAGSLGTFCLVSDALCAEVLGN